MTLFNKIHTGSKLFSKILPENQIFRKIDRVGTAINHATKMGQFLVPLYHNMAQRHLNHGERRPHNDLEKMIKR